MNPTEIITFLLTELYSLFGDLGLAIILLTLVLRSLLLPLTLPSIKAQKKIKDIKPEVDKLKKKHKNDAQAFQKSQLELYQKYNINPLAGCIPQIIQIVILILLYRALITFLGDGHDASVNMSFLWLDLGKPDPYFILPVLAGLSQLLLSFLIMPATQTRDIKPNKSKSKKKKEENKQEEDIAEMAQTMQQQMIFLMPLMTGFIALRFPSGLALYWVTSTLFSFGQQVAISGWGGLKDSFLRFKMRFVK
jgi:YidC/Oxa1 family membrane protein insertase